jgi:hypothetical protein
MIPRRVICPIQSKSSISPGTISRSSQAYAAAIDGSLWRHPRSDPPVLMR